MTHFLRSLILLTAVCTTFSIAQAIPSDTPATPTGDLIHFGDLIDVDVVGGFEYDWRGGLNPEGFLDGYDAYNEPIRALCRSEAEIAADVERSLGRILREPKVVVKIVDRTGRALVSLDGSVRTPTRFRLQRSVRLRELIVMAGGFSDGASGEITVFRPSNSSCRQTFVQTSAEVKRPGEDNLPTRVNIKISDLLAGRPEADPVIVSGDIITVVRALPVYVIGAVNDPRPIYSREMMTISRMIATAGGLAKNADPTRVFIFRREGLEVKTIETDLNKIEKGETVDEILRPFDIIEVASRGGTKRKYPPVIANDGSSGMQRSQPPLKIVD